MGVYGVLLAALRTLGDAPARSLTALAQRGYTQFLYSCPAQHE